MSKVYLNMLLVNKFSRGSIQDLCKRSLPIIEYSPPMNAVHQIWLGFKGKLVMIFHYSRWTQNDSPERTALHISNNAFIKTVYMPLLAQHKLSRDFDPGYKLPGRYPSVLLAETRLLSACVSAVQQCTCKYVHSESHFMVQYAIKPWT